MWIIPKPLHTSLSAPATEALTSDSEELSELFAQSLLARSKPSPAKTWSRRLKQGSLTLLPSGRILKPSLGQRFAEQWTSSLVASLASPSAPQVSVEETMTQDIFGRTSCEASESWDTLPLFSSRMSRGSSAQSSQVTSGATPQERPFCTMSSANWKDWVTAQRQDYSQRAKLASPISVNECSSWALDATLRTISVSGCHRSSEATSRPNSAPTSQDTSSQSPPLWSTPLASAQRGPASRDFTQCLHAQAKTEHEHRLWNSITARDWKGVDRNKEARGFSPSLPNQVQVPTEQRAPRQEALISTGGNPPASQANHNGKLNPRWVETLMGLPVGWTMRNCASPWTIAQTNCACLGTESSQTPPLVPLESFGKSWSTPDQAHGGTYRGKLNPRWVETLMGLPVGWVRPSATDIDNDND